MVKKILGLVEMTSGLVNASFSLPEWQALKMIFFAPCPFHRSLTWNACASYAHPRDSQERLLAVQSEELCKGPVFENLTVTSTVNYHNIFHTC